MLCCNGIHIHVSSVSPHGSCDMIQSRVQNETNVNRAISAPKCTISPARGYTPPEHSFSGASVSSLNQNHKKTCDIGPSVLQTEAHSRYCVQVKCPRGHYSSDRETSDEH